MRPLCLCLAAVFAATPVLADGSPFTVEYSQDHYEPGEVAELTVSGAPGTIGFLALDTDPGPTTIPGIGTFDLGFSSSFMVVPLPPMPPEGTLTFQWWCENVCTNPVTGTPFYTQAISIDDTPAICISNSDVLEVSDTLGNCPCTDCDGGVTSMTMQYQGAATASVEVVKDSDSFFSGTLDPGDTFSFAGDGPDMKLPKDIEFLIDGDVDIKVHTSCSKPIGPGLTFGSFFMISGVSKDGGIICTPPPDDCTAGKPAMLTLQYTGNSCDAEFLVHGQDDDKIECTGDAAMGDPVHIIVSDKDGEVLFEDDVALGGTFVVDAAVTGDSKLSSETHVDIFDVTSGATLQNIEFHTSCSQPLAVGNVFGSIVLTEFVPEA